MKIKKITKRHYNGKVYNIGVSNIHNYYVHGVLVSNCYTSALSTGTNFPNIIERFRNFFEPLGENRPYQVAIGGAGEPTLHPDFCEVLKTSRELDIMPNYTTNGMHLNDKILDATKEYCGGVAVSTHKHLKWGNAVDKLLNKKIRTNLHVIVGEEGSFDYMKACWEIFPEVETVVILPYQAQGRGKAIDEKIKVEEWQKCAKLVQEHKGFKFAFGALFYPFMKEHPELFPDVKVYEPEVFSGYVMFDEEKPFVRKSSYNLEAK